MKKILLLFLIVLSLFGLDNRPISPYYTCGLFKGPLITYDTIQGNGNEPKVCGSENLFAVKVNNSENIKCSASQNCENASECNIKKPSEDRYNPVLLQSQRTRPVPDDLNFTEKDYVNYDFDSPDLVLNFDPHVQYRDSEVNYSTFGAWTFKDNNITLNFKPGDYYFDSLEFDGSDVHINILDGGPVRIFVKENLQFYKNDIYINDNSDENNLFIYTGGNLEFKDTDNTPLHIFAFAYVKGNVEFKSSSDDFYWYGGITAEGDITIDSDYAHFIYRGTNLKLGYGVCPLCYADQVDGKWISIADLFKMTFNIPKRSAIINESNQTLRDLNVTLVETDPSWFNASTPQMYRLIDENNDTVYKKMENNTTYAYTNGLTGIEIKASIVHEGNGSVIAPPRGDIIPPLTSNNIHTVSKTTAYLGEYNATGFEHYNAIETTFGIDATIRGDNLNNFFASFYDEYGRYYKNAKLDYCENVPNGDVDPYNDIAGVVDAWDADENVTHRIVKTKIVSKQFTLKIAGIKNNQETALDKGNIKYALYDIFNRTEITPFYDFNTSNASIEHDFNISKSVKDVKVEFKICADVDENGTLILKNSSDCQGASEYKCRANPGNIGWRRCFSSDDFAIRPYKFVIESSPSVVRAGEKFNITLKALDYQNNPVQNYNETVSVVNSPRIRYIDNNPNANKLLEITSNRTFTNGVVRLTLKYPEVGEGVIKIDEVNGSEYGYVDEDDTPNGIRFIQSSTKNIKFIPYLLRIDAKYSNFNNSAFTYISNDLNMSSNLDINITALNKDGNITKYYNNNMYAKNITLKISHSVPSGIGSIKYLETSQNVLYNTNINNPIQLNVNKNYFTVSHKGKANLHIKINFPRNSRKPINSFNFTINDINVTDNDSNGSKNLNQFAKFYYGRVAVDNISGYASSLSVYAKYEYWTNSGWIINTDHSNNTFGEIKYLYIKPADVNYSKDTLNDAMQKLTLSTSHALPYQVKVHVAIPSWLWYHPLAHNYQDPSNANQNCLTHPCFKVSFLSESNGWGGIGIQEPKYEETNRTAEINSSLKTLNTDKKSVKKLNW